MCTAKRSPRQDSLCRIVCASLPAQFRRATGEITLRCTSRQGDGQCIEDRRIGVTRSTQIHT
ncbi:hypothetical protein CKY51_00770 [Xanthomonas maliensis]|nr:hypothetical protein CKY51_00770 [Xanthomonas maliensis]